MEIYLITDKTNMKQYVGQTIYTAEERWKTHLCGDLYIDNAIRDHGVDNFILETIDYCYSKQELDEKEKYWISQKNTLLPDGYNILPGGDCHVGVKQSISIEEYVKNLYLRKCNIKSPKRLKFCIINGECEYFSSINDFVKHYINQNSYGVNMAIKENKIIHVVNEYSEDFYGYIIIIDENEYLECIKEKINQEIKYYNENPECFEEILKNRKTHICHTIDAKENSEKLKKQRLYNDMYLKIRKNVNCIRQRCNNNGLVYFCLKIKDENISYKSDCFKDEYLAIKQCYNWMIANKYIKQ